MKSVVQLIFIVMFSQCAYASDFVSKDITVYKRAHCACCVKWADYLKGHGYNVKVVDTLELLSMKSKYKIPEKLAACHTAVIDGYVVEGHVTERDIRRLLLFRPDVIGIAVPGMPIGTPGMESGDTVESYSVMTFDEEGNIEVFVEH